MIRSFDYGDVRYFRMARSLFGRPVYWTGVYYADGLLVDTGPPNLWREMERLCRELQVRQCVTIHHSEDHIALWEPDRRWLFSGDLYLAPRLKYLRADENIYAMLDSLRRVLALEPLVLFCQHRGRVDNATAMLRQKLDFLVELGEKIHELRRKGLDERGIVRALPGSDLAWRLWTGGDFSKLNFVRAFLRSALTARL